MKTLNIFAGYYQNTWQGDFSLNICTGLDIFCSNPIGQIDTEMEVNTTIATLGISNQWILNFGLTITGDWFAYKSVLGSKKTTSVKANTYSLSLNDQAQEEIDDLAGDIVTLSGFPGILTLTLSWSF
jgi:hypothetical protein